MVSSKELKEHKALIELKQKHALEKHGWKMEELEYIRASDELHHERELTRGRIKSSEIKKMQERKEWIRQHANK